MRRTLFDIDIYIYISFDILYKSFTLKFTLKFICITPYKCVSPSSIAKATSCLSNPSIITSLHCRFTHRPSLRLSSLSFQKLEPKLREISLGTKALPARVSSKLFNLNFKTFMNLVNLLNTNAKIINYSTKIKRYNTLKAKSLLCIITGLNLIRMYKCKIKVRAMDTSPRNGHKDESEWLVKMLIQDGDVESNPGPSKMTLVSLNCRGLKNEEKLKQLLHRLVTSHDIHSDIIISLQETHLNYDTLKYRWKGSHVFTPSNGAKGGVITLFNDSTLIKKVIHIGHEAHVALLTIINGKHTRNLIIVNLHSPCAHNQHKIDFFKRIRDGVDEMLTIEPDAQVILMGDFNTTFNDGERINTTWSKREKNVAKKILSLFSNLYLRDCWSTNLNIMTWRHGDKMSKIDRVFVSDNTDLNVKDINTDWSYTISDHGAVVITLTPTNQSEKCSYDRVVRLDTRFTQNTILKHKFLTEIKRHYDQISEQNMNPHQELEFLKMAIRSSVIEIASNQKKERETLTKEIRRDINFWQTTYEQSTMSSMRDTAMTNLEKAKTKLDKYLEETGRYLCGRSKSMWYQEGEKSSKYFLNLERSKSKAAEMRELKSEGMLIYDDKEIDREVEKFYKTLYEKGDTMIRNKNKLDKFLTHIKPIDDQKNSLFNCPITIHDLKKTLQTCTDSAPGPDGIPYSLIKLTWNYYGPLLIKSWNYALETGTLTHSHEMSYLRLLPKEGKDPTELKNWRPITLSNCDFKVITKYIATKMTEAVTDSLNPTQTAYIKGRQITDNLHIMQYMTEKIAQSPNDSGMLISLDAEKAFDSIEHWYIKAVLQKLGLNWFNNIFDILYKNQRVTILNNKRNAGTYNIKNGVKQGDALSCILFIIGIEPLLKNIEADGSIKNIVINENILPKTLSYADDVACIVKPSAHNVEKIFRHYELMTELSGLKLNADKTEIISKGGPLKYNINYNHRAYEITPNNMIKINGLFLGFDTESSVTKNIGKIISSLEGQLRTWSHRHLSILGKIQIFKTFGLSQILFIGSTVKIPFKEEKKITDLIYKFIWTKHMDGNKAPDRIKRSILNQPTKLLGFGMIDFREVLRSIRIKTVLRLMNSPMHPLHNIIMSGTNKSIYLSLIHNNLRPCIDEAISDINKIWKQFIMSCPSTQVQETLNVIGKEYVGNVTINRFKNKRMGLKYRHDTVNDLLKTDKTHPMLKKLDPTLYNFIKENIDLNVALNDLERHELLPVTGKIMHVNKIQSKEIRSTIATKTLISYKLFNSPNPESIKVLGKKLTRMTNVKLKTIMLRSIHGDIYSGSRLKKFGMSDSDKCPRCNETETIEHQLLKCNYCRVLWMEVSNVTGIKVTSVDELLGLDNTHDTVTLTIHSEIIRKLLAIERPTCNPIDLLALTLNNLSVLERGITKYQINMLLKQFESTHNQMSS